MQIHTSHLCIVNLYEIWYKNHMNAVLTFTLFTCMFYERLMHGKSEAFRKAGTKKIEDTNFSPLPDAVEDKLGMSGFH